MKRIKDLIRDLNDLLVFTLIVIIIFKLTKGIN